jgi:hypothetical protein
MTRDTLLIIVALLLATVAVSVLQWTAAEKALAGQPPVRLWISSNGKSVVVQRLGETVPPVIASQEIHGAVGFLVEVGR